MTWPGQVFLAVPGLSDVQMEVQTGTQNRPAMLLRTAQGAVCPAEALIGSHCRGLDGASERAGGLVNFGKVLYKRGVWFVLVLLCSTYQCVIRWWNLWFCHWGLVLDSMFLWLMTCFYRIVHNAHCHIVVCCVFMPQPLKKKTQKEQFP
jgi:hypothetical protein